MGQSSSKSKETHTEVTVNKDSDSSSGCCITVKKVVARTKPACCNTQNTIDITVTGEKNKIRINK
mgnify:CR=1 FL=1